MIAIYVWTCIAGGIIFAAHLHDGKGRPTNQSVAGGIIFALLLPLNLLILVGVGLYKGVPWLARGFTGLYRSFFPPRVKLPKAKIHERQ